MTGFSDVPVLEGRVVRLEPLGPQHADDLARAVAVGELCRTWSARIPAPEDVAADIDHRLALAARCRVRPA